MKPILTLTIVSTTLLASLLQPALCFMSRPIDRISAKRLRHYRIRSIGDGDTFVPLTHDLSNSQLDAEKVESDVDMLSDDLCDAMMDDMGENMITSTFSEGTPAADIILTWEPDLAEEIKEILEKRKDQEKPLVIGVVGNPGSGKTTSCYSLSDLIDDCFVLPFDGYHIPMDELNEMPNSEDLIYRRGAPDTFEPSRLKADLERIRDGDEKIIKIPGFDHALGDPQPDEHTFDRSKHKIVFCEGLYLLHDDDRWNPLKSMFDMSIFVEANVDVCVERLKIRNLCIPGYTEEEILVRVDKVDRVNADTVETSKKYATKCVESAAQRAMTTTIADGTPETDVEVTWEKRFSEKIRKDLETRDADHPYMVALVGGPGSGKTTSCGTLLDLLDDLGCMIIPFDGYHYPIKALQAMPNPTDLIYRRGAPDTFDAERLKKDLNRIRSGSEPAIDMPGFDHAVGDPAEGEHKFDRSKHRVVFCEGLYLLHDGKRWEDVRDMFDYSIFVDADVDACIERLKIRNKCIPGYTELEIENRCEDVDRANAMVVDRSKGKAEMIVQSVV